MMTIGGCLCAFCVCVNSASSLLSQPPSSSDRPPGGLFVGLYVRNNSGAYLSLAEEQVKAGAFGAALGHFESALLAEEGALGHSGMADALARLGRLPDAIR